MQRYSNYSIFLAVCLSALAGFVDAVGFLYLGGYFISFMSGNSTRLAVGLAHGNWQAALLAGGLIAAFVTGAIMGTLIIRFFRGTQLGALVFTSVLLAWAALLCESSLPLPAMLLLVLAMGAENTIFQRDGDIVIGLTYMTGTLVKLGQRIAFALCGEDTTAWIPYLLLWSGLASGGVAGTICYQYMGLHSLWVAVAVAIIITFAMRKSVAEI